MSVMKGGIFHRAKEGRACRKIRVQLPIKNTTRVPYPRPALETPSQMETTDSLDPGAKKKRTTRER